MKRSIKIFFLFIILTGMIATSFADRGVSKKAKNKVTLNINTTNSFTNTLSFNLKSGLKYKGSLLTGNSTQAKSNITIQNTVITYQKGNTVYVVPYKQKIIVPEARQGYAGMKLIIKSS